MRVLFLGRDDLLKNIGGDRIQVEQTKQELEKLGVSVDLKTGRDFECAGYDLIHVFQLDWNMDCFYQVKKAKDSGLPVVLSAIHHSVAEVKRFDEEYVFDFRRVSRVLFTDQFNRDLFKEFYRSVLSLKRLAKVFSAINIGLKNTYKAALENADMVLVQTEKEVEDLKNTFQVNFCWAKVLNGVGAQFLPKATQDIKNLLPFEDYIICVGRLEPRKNQLSVIDAVETLRNRLNKDIKLVLIGSWARKKHFEYTYKIEKKLEGNKWIVHLPQVKYAKMPAYYKFAKVCVSASWFETTGLTSLEALYCGANAVASGERAQEYLKDMVSYCDPGRIESISDAILHEYTASRPVLDTRIFDRYTWANTARDINDLYVKLTHA